MACVFPEFFLLFRKAQLGVGVQISSNQNPGWGPKKWSSTWFNHICSFCHVDARSDPGRRRRHGGSETRADGTLAVLLGDGTVFAEWNCSRSRWGAALVSLNVSASSETPCRMCMHLVCLALFNSAQPHGLHIVWTICWLCPEYSHPTPAQLIPKSTRFTKVRDLDLSACRIRFATWWGTTNAAV